MPTRIVCLLLFTAGLVAQQQSPPASAEKFRISGIVVDAQGGEPLANARVIVISVASRDIEQAMVTDERGSFQFLGLATGKYSLAAERRGFPQQTLDAHEFYSTAIAVGPDKDSEHIVFRLQPDSSISGRVLDERGDPVREGEVMLFSKSVATGGRSTVPRGQVSLDDQGEFRFAHLPPRTYILLVSSRPWYAQYMQRSQSGSSAVPEKDAEEASLDFAYPVLYYPESFTPEEAQVIVLHPGDRFVADMTLRVVPALHFRVVNIPTDPSTDSRFVAMQSVLGDSNRYDSYLSEGGSVEIGGMAPGQYDLQMTAMGKSEAVSTRHLVVNAKNSGDLDVTAAAPYAALTGVVQYEGAANPPKSATIILRDHKTNETTSQRISATGTFDHLSLPPGRYHVFLQNSEGFLLKSFTARGASVIGQTLEIEGSEPVQLSVVATKATARVEGTVLREGKSFAGAMVVLVPPDPANNLLRFRRDQSDSDGTFTLFDVLPGKYTLLAIENGWELEWASPAVLRRYMQKGTSVKVEPDGKYNLSVNLQ